MKRYIIRHGDHLRRVCFERGLDPDAVWAHGDNADLRARRPSMDVLAAGDLVWLSDSPQTGLDFQGGSTNRYKATVPTTRVHLVLQRDGEPLAQEPYRVEGLRAPLEGVTGDDGAVAFDAPITAREAKLLLPKRNAVHPIVIGGLDPVEEDSGVRQRLAHLGYLGFVSGHLTDLDLVAARPSPARHADTDAQRTAIEHFQRDHNLEVTGVLDDTTRAALESAHAGES